VTVTRIIQIEANDIDQRNDVTLGMWESLKLIETVKELPCSLENGPRRIRNEGTAGCSMVLYTSCKSVVECDCERTAVLCDPQKCGIFPLQNAEKR